MLQSRRGFLIGAGSLLTTAFVSEATAFVRTTGKPLLFAPPDPNYWLFWNDFYRGFQLGPVPGAKLPPQPTWREFFTDLSNSDTPAEFADLMRRYRVPPERLDEPVDRWESRHFDIYHNNTHFAAAYRMLKRIDLGPSLDGRYRGPCLEFYTGWVTITHPLALSLLQARLLDLKLPVCVRLMSAAPTTIDCHRQVDEFVRASMTGKDADPRWLVASS
jgi:hypothetical protein